MASRIVLEPTYTPIPTMTSVAMQSDSTRAVSDGTTRGENLQPNPLTGEIITETENLLRRPLAVKISNAPASYTRPQSGLSSADIVFEHVTESSITRFTAIIYGKTPEKLGPIRSARLIDLQIPIMYDAALVYSGSSIGVSRLLFSDRYTAPIIRSNEEGYYRTGENKPYEHTLYANPEGLWSALERQAENRPPVFYPLPTFSIEPPAGGISASSATIRYRSFTEVVWRYDTDSEKFLRWADGEPHTDANNGDQIKAANVVLLMAPHFEVPSICEYQVESRCLAYSVDIQLTGSGPAVLLRDGYQYDVTWRRTAITDLITLVNGSGLVVPLKPGNTWYQVIPLDYPNPIDIN